MTEPEWLTTKHVAKLLSDSQEHVRELIKQHQIEAIDISTDQLKRASYRINRESLNEFIRRRTVSKPKVTRAKKRKPVEKIV